MPGTYCKTMLLTIILRNVSFKRIRFSFFKWNNMFRWNSKKHGWYIFKDRSPVFGSRDPKKFNLKSERILKDT